MDLHLEDSKVPDNRPTIHFISTIFPQCSVLYIFFLSVSLIFPSQLKALGYSHKIIAPRCLLFKDTHFRLRITAKFRIVWKHRPAAVFVGLKIVFVGNKASNGGRSSL